MLDNLKACIMHNFSQFFDYTERDIPLEDFDEYFLLAKRPCEFWDMLAGAIYNYNYSAFEYLLNKHDYHQYEDDIAFKDLMEESLSQITDIEHSDVDQIIFLLREALNISIPVYNFSNFFDYTDRQIPIEDFDEYFMLAKTPHDFWDMLAGAIYNYNYKVLKNLLSNHDYTQYRTDLSFQNLVEQCLYQIANVDHQDARDIIKLVSKELRM